MLAQVQRMIKREVRHTIKENEDSLRGLIETVHQLDSEADYEGCFQNLEVSYTRDVGVKIQYFSSFSHVLLFFFNL